jgi:hypothetical protein
VRDDAPSDSIGAHGSRDVLDLLLAEIVEGEVEAVAHLLVRRGAETDPARLGQRFKPGGNVDAVAEDVAILDDDVTEIDAHAKFDAALCRCCGVAGDHLALQFDRTAHRVDDAGKFHQQAVAGGLDDATPMLGDFGIAEFTANRPQCCERALLVLAHKPRIAGNIDSEDRRQPALDPLSAHPAGPATRCSTNSMMEIGRMRAASALRELPTAEVTACHPTEPYPVGRTAADLWLLIPPRQWQARSVGRAASWPF